MVTCKVAGCIPSTDIPARKGYCDKHYSRLYRRGTLEPSARAIAFERSKRVATEGMKLCTQCDRELPIGAFTKRHYRKNLHASCKDCVRMYNAQPDVRRRTISNHLKRKYGITLEDYERMFDAQGRKCAICGTMSNAPFERFAIDHDHGNKKVRAILCNRCNSAIGLMDESPEKLEKAIAYLHKYSNN